jgi:CubicO group peptidase (beta-lactamase class C family)
LFGSVGAGLTALTGASAGAQESDSIRSALAQAVGNRANAAGMVGAIVDKDGTRLGMVGNSGVPGVALDADAVFEIMSITKVLTSLILTDMVARGEVAFDDWVAKYLPAGVTLHQRGRPITLLDLANYTSGLPNMPGNVPPNWWATPGGLRDYTEAQLYAFLSSHEPKYEPGTHYEYANLGFGLLGNALAHRAGKSYEALLIERICGPLSLEHTRITLSDDMRAHLVQAHDVQLKPTPLWEFPAIPGAGYVRSNAKDLAAFLKACMGLAQTPLSAAIARLVQTRRPTPVAGTEAALGWFVSSAKGDEIVWKTGLSGGTNTFIGFSTRSRRGAIVLSNFLWQPIDVGTIDVGMKLINPNFVHGNLDLLYLPA